MSEPQKLAAWAATCAPPAALASAPASSGIRRTSRLFLIPAFLLALSAFLPDAFGRQVFLSKLNLIVDPAGLLHGLLYLWDPLGWFGFLQDQYQGYAFPLAPLFAIGHLAHIPGWLLERFWPATWLTIAFWGLVRLADELGVTAVPAKLAGGAAYALWPLFTILVGSDPASVGPSAFLPFVLVPLVRGSRSGSPVRAALLSAGVVLLIGGVNAADTIDALTVPAIYLLTREPSARKRTLLTWWTAGVVLATAWWALPLLFLGKYGYNFLPYIEQSVTTTSTTSATAVLLGTGDWTAYLRIGGIAWDQAGLTVVGLPVVLLGAALLAGAGLAGVARSDMVERRFFRVVVAFAVLATTSGYWGPLGSPLGGPVRALVDGVLAPFRNVYKFEPLLALAIAMGLVHLLAAARPRLPRRLASVPLAALAVLPLASLATPYFLGRGLQGESFSAIPRYWSEVAAYLARHSPRNTALVLPAAAHGWYDWGWTIDEPLEMLARSPWSDRETVPYGGPRSARMIDAIDQAMSVGEPVPALTDVLSRSGVEYVVAQNDTEWRLSGSPSPLALRATLERSGLVPVASFGQVLGAQQSGEPRAGALPFAAVPIRAVEIYRIRAPPGSPGAGGPVALYPVSSAVLVTGGPEAVLQASNGGLLRPDEAAVLAADWTGAYRGPLAIVTDTLRHQEVDFGLVNDNYSYVYAPGALQQPTNRQPGGPAPLRQLLPFPGIAHQAVAQFENAVDVTASSYGSWATTLPEYNPANVFLAGPNAGWVAGDYYGSVGQWIRITFLRARPVAGAMVTLLAGHGRAVPTQLEVTTSRGSVVDQVRPTAGAQRLSTPPGSTPFLQITFRRVVGQRRGHTGAGIRHISIPGLVVSRYVVPPEESQVRAARRVDFSFATLPFASARAGLEFGADAVMERLFTTFVSADYSVTGVVTPVGHVGARRLVSSAPAGGGLFGRCGAGPPLRIDGRTYRTEVDGTVSELRLGEPLELRACTAGHTGSILLAAGRHLLSAPVTTSPFRIVGMTLATGSPPPAPAGRRSERVIAWRAEDRTVRVGPGGAAFLELHQNFNAGWTATLDGRRLSPIVLDGWQQGYVVPAGRGGTVHLRFGPEQPYLVALALSGLGVLLLVLLIIGPFGLRRRGGALPPAGPWSRRVHPAAGLVVATGVVVAAGGAAGIFAILVAVAVRRWPKSLPWLAFAALVVAGTVAAVSPGTGAATRLGAFSAPAQTAALVGLASVLAPVRPYNAS